MEFDLILMDVRMPCMDGLAAKRLLQLIESRQFDEIHSLAHNMNGTGRSYGFHRLTELGFGMKISADAADIEALRGQVADLEEYLGRVQ